MYTKLWLNSKIWVLKYASLILSSKIQETKPKGSCIWDSISCTSFLCFRGTKCIPTWSSLQPVGKPWPGIKTSQYGQQFAHFKVQKLWPQEYQVRNTLIPPHLTVHSGFRNTKVTWFHKELHIQFTKSGAGFISKYQQNFFLQIEKR